ncbi:MAG: hypothetical protein JWR09_1259 [Mucilaginibacter sp.]|nr:hypothetical protein [Mucilaginibacter sp.]
MYHKRVFLFLLFFILSLRSFSAVFVVTSKADSGPGTLREALTLAEANGTAETDYINFNLSDLTVAGRTISLLSRLPDLTSNLVIDGSTQPGSKIGISDAKIVLEETLVNAPQYFVDFFCKDCDNVEIDGFYFSQINRSGYQGAIFIRMEYTTNIIIGRAGKGNVFGAADWDTYLLACNHMKISGNFWGINPITEDEAYTAYSGNMAIYACDDILIGGDTRPDGNIFVAAQNEFESQIYGDGPGVSNPLETTKCIVKNNTLGYYAKRPVHAFLNFRHLKDVIFQDNIIDYASGINITDAYGEVTIKGNKCNGDNVHPEGNSSEPTPFQLYQVKKAVIGGLNPGDANIVVNPYYTGFISPGIFAGESYDILIQRNSIGCITSEDAYISRGSMVELPVVNITIVSGNVVAGTATPGAVVEVFSDGGCQLCEPTHYSGSVTAGADGSWSYAGAAASTGYTASASLNGRTSLFAKVGFDIGNVVLNYPSCGKNDGSITGVKVVNSTKIEWTNEAGTLVSDKPDAENLPPGKYTLTVYSGAHCVKKSDPFELIDATPVINDGNLQITQPSCGSNTGSITNLYLQNPELLYNDADAVHARWFDASEAAKSNGWDLINAEAGAYHLEVSYKNKCTVTYGPVILKNTTGPNIDQSTAIKQSTNCGQSTGSITNVTVTGTGTLKYIWINSQQQQVGFDKDLLNQPAGTYKLQVTDDTQCGPIYTTDIVIPETNGVTLDESKVQTSIASCSQNNGSITGITFSGATKFQWVDANNQVVATTADLKNAVAGDYTFIASNNFGCSKTSKVYHVDQQAPVQFPQYAATIVPSCFGDNSGSVSVVIDGLAKSVRWVNSQGATVGNQVSLLNTAAGTYQLYLTDQNGCENYYKSYTVTESPEYIVADYGQHIDEQCGLKNGSITGVNITGGIPPYTYTWLNAANQTIGSGNTITQLAAGTYILNVVDTRCGNVDITYTITDESADVAAPLVSDLQLCSSGSALLIVNNASSSVTYRLYDTQSSAHPIDEQKGGRFNISVNANRSYFVSQLNGTCESARAEVKVAVGLSVVNIANTFTPNGDGINDYWKITSIENYSDAVVQVFSRYGQKVYESKGYGSPFEGNLNGKKLPAGVYYYIINLKTNCNILSGSLTIIR